MKLIQKIIILTTILMFVTWALYLSFGQKLITDMFYGKSFSFLNDLISNTTGDQVDYYLKRGDSLAIQATLAYLLVLIIYFASKVLSKLKILGPTILGVFVSIILYEGLLLFFYAEPQYIRSLSTPFVKHLKAVYESIVRDNVTTNPKRYRYDPEVTYTLAPGSFIFANPEFENKFFVNSMGLRDDDESLSAPEIITLGDSHTMGWGVEQDETYAQIIEKELGLKVLNAGINSYATAREMKLLNRLDLSNLQYLIIQYSANDILENLHFVEHGELRITSEAAYRRRAEYNQAHRPYYPMKYIINLGQIISEKSENIISPILTLAGRPVKPQINTTRADLHVNALLDVMHNATEVDLSNVQIILMIFGIDGYIDNTGDFIIQLEKAKQQEHYPTYIQNLIAIDVNDQMLPEYYYALDGHPNAKGQEFMAEKLIEAINH